MGFLLGAYSKQMAGKRVRSLQARMVHVQSQLRRATRDIEQREKYWQAVQRNAKNSIQSQVANFTMAMSQGLQGNIWNNIDCVDEDTRKLLLAGDKDAWSGLTTAQAQAITKQMNDASNQNNYITQAMQSSMQQTLAMQENDIEMAKEADLQPLKDLEDELQTEKDSLESQIQLAQADYDACKEMEKAGVKALTPNYTGQA